MAVLKWKDMGNWVTLYSASIKNKLRKDANLADIPDKIAALRNLNLVGDISSPSDPENPTDKHNHDKRYKSWIENVRNDFKTAINRFAVSITGDVTAPAVTQDKDGKIVLHAENVNATNCYIRQANRTTQYRLLVQAEMGKQPILMVSNTYVDELGNFQNNRIHTGDLNVDRVVRAAKVFNAVWNDYAELFPKHGEVQPGELVALDMDAEEEGYVKADKHNHRVVGVCSNEYAHLIGGEEPPEGEDYDTYNMKKYIPVALAGRVHVYVQGNIQKGDYLVPGEDGCARAYQPLTDDANDILGMAVEASNAEGKHLVRMKIR